MNTSEIIAYDWLKKEYPNVEIKFRSTQTPDFLLGNDKSFEVKKLYGKVIILYKEQIDFLKEDTVFLIIHDGKIIDKFLWKDREQSKYPIKVITNNLNKLIKIDKLIYEKLKEINESPKKAIDIIFDKINIIDEVKKQLEIEKQRNVSNEGLTEARVQEMIDLSIEEAKKGY